MTYEMNEKQFESVTKLPAEKRYQHFISKIADWEQIWSLRDSEGFVSLADDNDNACLVFWPHPEYAKVLADKEWADCIPTLIDLTKFLEKWLPGMEKDGIKAAVFPTPDSQSIIVDPQRLRSDIERECEQYQHEYNQKVISLKEAHYIIS